MGSKIRHVRTPEGARYYDAPIGTPITADLKVAAKFRSAAKGRAKAQQVARSKGGGTKTRSYDSRVGSVTSEADAVKVIEGIRSDYRNKVITRGEAAALLDRLEAQVHQTGDKRDKDKQGKTLSSDLKEQVDTAEGVEDLKRLVALSSKLDDADRTLLLDQIERVGRAKGFLSDGDKDADKPKKAPEKPDTPPVDADKPKVGDQPTEPDTKPEKPKKAPKRPAGAKPTESEYDVRAAQEQAKHFQNGEGTIADAKSEGLWNHVLTDSRFKVKAVGAGKGVSDSFWVTDTATDETWLFKRGFYEESAGVPEHVNERMAGSLMSRMGMAGSTIKMASDPGTPGGMIAQRHWGEEHGGDILPPVSEDPRLLVDVGDNEFEFTPEAIQKIKDGPEPEAPLKMILLDYLINNGLDRHVNNIVISEDENGNYRMGAIDHGLAFGAEGIFEKADLHELGFDDFFGTYVPEFGDVDPDNPDAGGRSAWSPSVIAAEVAGNKRALRKQIKTLADEWAKISMDEVFAEFEKDELLTEKQLDYMDEWLGEFEWRAQWLRDNVNTVADLIAKKGGL